MEPAIAFIYALLISLLLAAAIKGDILTLLWRNKKFNCLQCGRCCTFHVKLTNDDIENIKKSGFALEIEEKRGDKYIKRKNGYCPYMAVKDGKSKCEIYSHRPDVCRNFPGKKILGMKANDIRCRAVRGR